MKKAAIALSMLVTLFVVLVQFEVLASPFEALNLMADAGAVTPPQVSFSGGLQVGGTIDAQAGIQFPDGTVQLSAAGAATDLTANAGLYNNRIVEFSPPLPYVEVCFKNGDFDFDLHVNGADSTAGGDCLPGDVGWVIEREERVAAFWEDARADCLIDGMRLPEAFEFLFSCRRDEPLALLDMTGNFEWVSNEVSTILADSNQGVGVSVAGASGCSQAKFEWIARNSNAASATEAYRCVR